MRPLPGAQVLSLIEELRSLKPPGIAKKKKKKSRARFCPVNQLFSNLGPLRDHLGTFKKMCMFWEFLWWSSGLSLLRAWG